MEKPRLSVVIPSFQGSEWLLMALQSVQASNWQPEDVIVVDNASNDGTVERVENSFPGAVVRVNQSNQGFGMACNQGINMARHQGHDYVLLLNQDARLNPDTIGSIVGLAEENPQSAVVGCCTLSTKKFTDGTPIMLYNGSWRTILPTIQWIPGVEGSSAIINTKPKRVNYVWGHGMLLRVSALDQVGLFDPNFFMYYEDLDLCWRLEKSGWEIWCDSRVIIWHEMDDSARSKNSELLRWRYKVKSTHLFYRKYFSFPFSGVLWLVASAIEWYWLLKKRRTQAMSHLANATISEIFSAVYGFFAFRKTSSVCLRISDSD